MESSRGSKVKTRLVSDSQPSLYFEEIVQLVVNYVLMAGMMVHNMYHAFQVTKITNVTKNDHLW